MGLGGKSQVDDLGFLSVWILNQRQKCTIMAHFFYVSHHLYRFHCVILVMFLVLVIYIYPPWEVPRGVCEKTEFRDSIHGQTLNTTNDLITPMLCLLFCPFTTDPVTLSFVPSRICLFFHHFSFQYQPLSQHYPF